MAKMNICSLGDSQEHDGTGGGKVHWSGPRSLF